MGAYLSQPVTDKETFVGAKAGFLEYGGSSMQARTLFFSCNANQTGPRISPQRD